MVRTLALQIFAYVFILISLSLAVERESRGSNAQAGLGG